MPEITQEMFDFIVGLMEGSAGGDPQPPPPHGGTITFAELNLAAVFVNLRDNFENHPSQGLKGALVALGQTAYKLSEVEGPVGAVFAALAPIFIHEAKDLNSGYMADIGWADAFSQMAEQAYQYENEEGRETPLSLGEAFRIVGSGVHKVRPGTGVYRSKNKPSGVRKPESVTAILGNVQSLAFSLGRWFGCWRAPRVPVEYEPLPPDWIPPWSQPNIP
jgi:hypothetical protein